MLPSSLTGLIRGRTSRPRDISGRRRRVTFFDAHGYGTGGVPRTVFAVANELAGRGHDVEVVSVIRHRPKPYVDVHPDVRVTPLLDLVGDSWAGEPNPRPRHDKRLASFLARRWDSRPSSLSPAASPTFSALTDRLMRAKLASLPPGIVVTTRPELAVAATRWAQPDMILINQEHLTHTARPEPLRRSLAEAAETLDALLTLTEADCELWRAYVGATGTLFDHIPNASPFPVGPPAELTEKVVIAAGRLTGQKAFDRLIRAFQPITEMHPDWQLHIYGVGPHERKLKRQVRQLKVGDQVKLKGFADDFEERLASASIYAMSSRFEGLPMVLLEAMSKGVPAVSFDCPQGPRQLIDDGVNGILVPNGDVEALSAGIRSLIADRDLRIRLGAAALKAAEDYQIGPIVDRWETLFDRLEERRRQGGPASR